MPTTSERLANADPSAVNDPAHPDHENTDHTLSTGEKPSSFLNVLTDPSFTPTTTKAPLLRKLQSLVVLLSLVGGGMLAARTLLGIELLRTEWPVFLSIGTAVVGAVFVIAGDVDWWELVLAYWWLSVPVGGAAALALVLLGERVSGMHEVA